MKKLLLVSTAIAGVALATPAHAALKMDLGGYFAGYGVYADNNEPNDAVGSDTSSLHKFEFRRDNEVHVNGEATLDNGLTIGAHTEFKVAQGANTVTTDETYAYGSGGWGRVNLGAEDGAAYLLQVAAPSADSNVDGMRVYIQALNPITPLGSNVPGLVTTLGNTSFSTTVLDYQHADFRQTDRLTYLTPKFDGFQAGVSYAPKSGFTTGTGGMSLDSQDSGVVNMTGAAITSATAGVYKNLWEASARWDGEFQGVAGSIGAGYSDSSLNKNGTATDVDLITGVAGNNTVGDYALSDGVKTWNGGASLSTAGFTLGGSYKRSQTSRVTDTGVAGAIAGAEGDITSDTWVAGLAYDNGPYHVGGSYLHTKIESDALNGGGALDVASTDQTAHRYTVGGGYTYGPGMTFRGSVAWGKFDADDGVPADSNKFTQVAVGTDIQF